MIVAEGTSVALVRLAASVETPLGGAIMTYGAATLKPYMVPSDTITHPSLGERSPCCLKAERLEVLAVEPGALHQDERMDVPMGAVIIVHRGNKLNLFTKPLFQGKHCVDGDLGQIQVFVAVFMLRGGTDDYAVKDGALLRVIYHAVGLLFREGAIIVKERACGCVAVSVSPVGNVTDGCLCSPLLPIAAFDIIGLHNRH
jgi:hypothetical protein